MIGKVLISLREIDSTNSYAKEMLSKSKPEEGTAIFARYQGHGRGQYGKNWQSEPGKNLLCSIILYPEFLIPSNAFQLTKAVSMALTDFCRISLNVLAEIKWPNDIYAGGRKLGGVLIENSVNQSGISDSVIGIGLNVNQTVFGKGLNATSLKMLLKTELNLEELKSDMFQCLDNRYSQLKALDFETLDNDYQSRLYRMGELSEYLVGNKSIQGQIIGVNQQGKLMLIVDGKTTIFNHGEITFL